MTKFITFQNNKTELRLICHVSKISIYQDLKISLIIFTEIYIHHHKLI